MKKVNEIKKTVADNLKKYRQEKGMTQKELADEVNAHVLESTKIKDVENLNALFK